MSRSNVIRGYPGPQFHGAVWFTLALLALLTVWKGGLRAWEQLALGVAALVVAAVAVRLVFVRVVVGEDSIRVFNVFRTYTLPVNEVEELVAPNEGHLFSRPKIRLSDSRVVPLTTGFHGRARYPGNVYEVLAKALDPGDLRRHE